MNDSVDPALPLLDTNLGPYIGAVLLGTCLAMALWGIAFVQGFYFFLHQYPGDSWRLKALVIWTIGMDTVQKCLMMMAVYRAVVSSQTVNPLIMRREYIIVILVTVFVSTPIQIYFTWRLWRFRTAIRWIFVVILVPAIFCHFAMAIAVTVTYLRLTKFSTDDERKALLALVIVNLASEAGTDVILAVGLCAILWRTYLQVTVGHGENMITSTSQMIRRLMLLSINTGVLTATFGIITMAMSIRFPTYHLHIGVCFMIAPIYSNMLLANLNARAYIRDREDAIEVIQFKVTNNRSILGGPIAGASEVVNNLNVASYGHRSDHQAVRSRIDGATSGDYRCAGLGAVRPKDASTLENSRGVNSIDQSLELRKTHIAKQPSDSESSLESLPQL